MKMADITTESVEASPVTESKPERPAHVPEKFWDPDAGAPRTDDLAKSYVALESAMGRRLQEVSPETRRIIAETFEDDVKKDWAAALKAKLAEDEEFLTPLQEKWKAENSKTVPEAYELPELPDGRGFDPEHPLYAKATEIAKKHGLDQDGFGELMTFVTEAQADATHALSGATPEAWKAAIPDLGPRGEVVANRLQALAPEHAKELLENLRSPNAFLAVEKLIKAAGPKSLALDGVAANGELSQEQIDAMILSPDYNRAGSEARAKVDSWYKRRHSDQF
jgi:hypothetical protein